MRFDPRRVEKTDSSIFDALDVGGCRCIWMYMDVDGLEEDWMHGMASCAPVWGFSGDLFKNIFIYSIFRLILDGASNENPSLATFKPRSLEASKPRKVKASKPRVASAGIAKRNQFQRF